MELHSETLPQYIEQKKKKGVEGEEEVEEEEEDKKTRRRRKKEEEEEYGTLRARRKGLSQDPRVTKSTGGIEPHSPRGSVPPSPRDYGSVPWSPNVAGSHVKEKQGAFQRPLEKCSATETQNLKENIVLSGLLGIRRSLGPVSARELCLATPTFSGLVKQASHSEEKRRGIYSTWLHWGWGG